jgi:hypothetical protein
VSDEPRPPVALRSGPIIEALHEAGLMPPLRCGDVTIYDEYNGPHAGRLMIRFDCLADERVLDALRNVRATE